MRQKLHILWRCSKGAALLEYAFILPVLILLFMGIVEFGLIMFAYAQMEGALTEFGRASTTISGQACATNPGACGGQAPLEAFFERAVVFDRDKTTICATSAATLGALNPRAPAGQCGGGASAGSRGQYVLYDFTYAWPIFTPFLGPIIGSQGGPGCPAGTYCFLVNSIVVVKNE